MARAKKTDHSGKPESESGAGRVGREAASGKIVKAKHTYFSAKSSKSIAASSLAGSHNIHAASISARSSETSSEMRAWSYRAIKSGMHPSDVRALEAEGALQRADIAMIIPLRTFERRMAEDQPLKLEEADGIARLVRVVTQARQVFGDAALAEEFLRGANPALGGEAPMTLARTDVGGREVEAVLGRIAHGVFS